MRAALGALQAIIVGAWLGAALIVAFVVAPRAFAAFPTRAQAGSFVGSVLWVVNGGMLAAGLVALGAAIARGGARLPLRLGLAGALAALGVATLTLQSHIESLRMALGPIDALAPEDPRRLAFGKWHGVSVLLLLAAMLAGAGALVLERLE